MQYNGVELNCTEAELQEFLAGLTFTHEVRDFLVPFNGICLENKTGDPAAKYYVLTVAGQTFLQAHTPFDPGFLPITDANAEGIVETHKQHIIDSLVIAQFMLKPEDELVALKANQALMQTALDELILGGAL